MEWFFFKQKGMDYKCFLWRYSMYKTNDYDPSFNLWTLLHSCKISVLKETSSCIKFKLKFYYSQAVHCSFWEIFFFPVDCCFVLGWTSRVAYCLVVDWKVLSSGLNLSHGSLLKVKSKISCLTAHLLCFPIYC